MCVCVFFCALVCCSTLWFVPLFGGFSLSLAIASQLWRAVWWERHRARPLENYSIPSPRPSGIASILTAFERMGFDQPAGWVESADADALNIVWKINRQTDKALRPPSVESVPRRAGQWETGACFHIFSTIPYQLGKGMFCRDYIPVVRLNARKVFDCVSHLPEVWNIDCSHDIGR